MHEATRKATEHARRQLADGTPREEILAGLAAEGERLAGEGTAVSILVIDEEGFLRNGSSPNLPADYLGAIVPLKPNANIGTCAAAAATGCVVITDDFHADDKWAELRHLPLSLGYVGAWSMPIKAHDGTVLGTFGTYYRDRRAPSKDERDGVAILAATAAEVLAG